MKIRPFLCCLFLLSLSILNGQSDDCPAAELIQVFEDCQAAPSATFSLNNFSTQNTCNGNTDDDGWFRFIAISPRTQVVIFSDQLANMAISAFETCRKEIVCVNDRGMGGQEFLVFDTNIDQEYLIQVYNFTEGGGGFLICLTAEYEVFPNDCPGATILCEDGLIPFTPIGAGKDDFADNNNLAGCLSQKENNTAWYYFEIMKDAPPNQTLTFSITPNNNSDLDFAIYGPNVICDALGAPIRCSFADQSCAFCPMTGLGMNARDASEGVNGDGFLAPLTVQPGTGYFMLLDNAASDATSFTLEWGGSGANFLKCSASLPCGLTLDAGNTITVCEENTVNLNAIATGATSNIKYQWRGTSTIMSYLSSPFSATPIVTLPNDFEGIIGYELTAIATNGCKVKDSVFIKKQCIPIGNCPTLRADLNLTSINCTNINSGGMQIGLIEGGIPPYLFQLDFQNDFQKNPSFQNLNEGNHLLIIQDANGCQSDTTFTLVPTDLPTLEIGNDIAVNQGAIIDLKAISNFLPKQIKNITWSNISEADCPPPCLSVRFNALRSGTIQATLETIDNCIITDELQLTVQPKIDIYIPSAFSPNGDGINDNFSILAGAGIEKIITLQIFDRWGNLVFRQNNFLPNNESNNWNGKWNNHSLDNGVYLYYVELGIIDGPSVSKSGDIFLIK